MVNNTNSGLTKRRKSRKSINFKTARERRRANSSHRVDKPLDSLIEKAGSSKARAQSTVDYDEENNDPSVSSVETSTKELLGSRTSHSSSTGIVSRVQTKEKSPSKSSHKSRSSKVSDEKSGKDAIFSGLKKAKTPQEAYDKMDMGKKSKSEKKFHQKDHKLIDFATPRERKMANSCLRQERSFDVLSETATRRRGKKTTDMAKSNNSVSTVKPSVTVQEDSQRIMSSTKSTVSQMQMSQPDREIFPRKRSRQSCMSSVQMSGSGSTSKNPKRAKMLRDSNNEPSSSDTVVTKRTGAKVKTRPRKIQTIPDRIRDLKVTKKAFGKWKPIASLTKEYVEQIMKSVVLNVIANTSAQENQEAVKCLTVLKNRVLERLPDLKAPYTQGDYRKMESQNKESEEVFLGKSRELNMLDKKLEEEQRLLEVESALVEEYTNKLELCKKELTSLDNEKAHPLIRGTKNVLDLPELSEEFIGEEEVPSENRPEENQLIQTLVRLREKAVTTGLTKWMDRLERLTEDLLA